MPEPLAYRVQKHAARRLHYDFRLELGGVLKSWAVTRGPSLVAGERRLAVEVEDHSLDYADYEGVIAAGSYGAGVVLLWDRGIWEPDGDPAAALAAGSLAFTLLGEKLSGRWRLTRMKPRPRERHVSWLLVKSRDAIAREPGEPDILEEQPRSVLTGCTVEEIAAAAA
ncbi:DNA polymerase ligase N-terminal domain-containing protein [Methylobacterium sp. J-070]|uniref:DNA polymerase ligase N-terminal domain-containing protein n=1 Tax=Methylobacterium sp. J-070 TaxID=2836650 RepID=UPI0028C3FFDD|nr:DNA polymerase ligase N-terminal domain-containing protein [Methylobacterium sp. J-070]